jgi:hypothetical protein
MCLVSRAGRHAGAWCLRAPRCTPWRPPSSLASWVDGCSAGRRSSGVKPAPCNRGFARTKGQRRPVAGACGGNGAHARRPDGAPGRHDLGESSMDAAVLARRAARGVRRVRIRAAHERPVGDGPRCRNDKATHRRRQGQQRPTMESEWVDDRVLGRRAGREGCLRAASWRWKASS